MYVHYDDITGKIYGCMRIPPTTVIANVALLPENTSLIEWPDSVDENLYYFDGANSFIIRPTIDVSLNKTTIASDGLDTSSLTGLPIPCLITIDEQEFTVDDGVFEFATETSGVYKITLTQFPYIPKTIEVEAI